MRFPLILLAAAATAACASSPPPDPDPTPVAVTEKQATIAAPLKYGDCVEALRRAALKNDLEVDRLPTPVKYDPPPIPRLKTYPKGVFGKDTSEIRITVMVDTLGQPDMTTFTVVKSTHPWLAKTIKTSVGKWKFTPAELVGCKVPRVFKFAVVSPPLPQKGRRRA